MALEADTTEGPLAGSRGWFGPGVAGIGAASFLADVGHEVSTALLPGLLTATFGVPAAALGVIEGVADGVAGIARLAGGALADDPGRRRSVALGGYASTAILAALIGVATSAWQVGILRSAAWSARGLRVPARNALLADVVPAEAYGRAYGFERTMDNLGAIGGPLLALGLVTLVGVRTAILLSVIPGLLAALAVLYAVAHIRRPAKRERQPIYFHIRPLMSGPLGSLMVGVGAFEAGNVAATLLILRATQLLAPELGQQRATQLALVLYILYNISATVTSLPAGHWGDRKGPLRVFVTGLACFFLAYIGLATGATSLALLAVCFTAAGIAIGCLETSEHAAVANLAPPDRRGSAFGLLATVQAFGNLAASAIAGALWTLVSAQAAFVYLAAWMLVSFAAIARLRGAA